MEPKLKRIKIVEVLDPRNYGSRVYKLEGKDLPSFANVKLDFSALAESKRSEEMARFHTDIEKDGTIIARIHKCMRTPSSPKLNDDERYAFPARRESERHTIPSQCSRCHGQH